MFRTASLLSLLALPAFAEPPKVVADIAPVHALVAQVMEGVGEPDLLLDQDANPHAAQLRPSQARMLAEADLVIWVGPELSPWLEHTIDGLGTADSLVLMESPATTLRDFAAPAEEDDHDHGEDHDDHADDDHAEDDHDHGDKDPHLWLSVDNARAWLGLFADELATRDPDNADTYRANALKAQAGIDGLAAGIEATLAPHAGAEIVTFHAAFGYFADRFPVTVVGSVRPGDAASPSAAALAALRDLVAEHDIACAFAEPAFDPGLIDAIAGDTGLRIGVLDPTGALQEPGPGHYAATLQTIADGIVECIERE
ncbi:zinc ABC transporter substrate-binding protein [Sinisalibacter aestuarii]|uniref:High-affinity zinc uptake system protein ZnuA n=1 Tax=Sinisalibacter aestuarii TaxID=2949426 RepID=A0ABQ5LSP2_9RHOB|nr:zinc ABC transporter substrate-binding protein [Sinisalibacter aestuarii]GKY87430.1 zinc transporter [Sinisalibacter aestuarii]